MNVRSIPLIFVPHLTAALAMGQQAVEEVGSKICSGCHAEIYRHYSVTSMSRSSGKAGAGLFHESFDAAGFRDLAVGAEYGLSAAPEGYRMRFSREASGVNGERLLRWFVGSGRVARSSPNSAHGVLCQAPDAHCSPP